MTPSQTHLLTQALTLDVKFQKAFTGVTTHLHKNPSPDLEWMDTRVADAGVLVREWLILSQSSAAAQFYGNKTVEEYFAISLQPAMDNLTAVLARTHEIIALGHTPRVTNPDAERIMHYTPETHMSVATRELAAILNVDIA
jgi:hypothetical protein